MGVGTDEKAKQSFFGMLLETGMGYEIPFGLTIAGDSVMVATNGGQIREMELTGDLSFDRNRDERSLTLNVVHNWEMEYSETDKPLWSDSLLNNTAMGTGKTDSRIEAGYGFDILDESAVLPPYSAFHQMIDHESEFHLGSRIKTSTGIGFELKSGRSVPEFGAVSHEINLTGNSSVSPRKLLQFLLIIMILSEMNFATQRRIKIFWTGSLVNSCKRFYNNSQN